MHSRLLCSSSGADGWVEEGVSSSCCALCCSQGNPPGSRHRHRLDDSGVGARVQGGTRTRQGQEVHRDGEPVPRHRAMERDEELLQGARGTRGCRCGRVRSSAGDDALCRCHCSARGDAQDRRHQRPTRCGPGDSRHDWPEEARLWRKYRPGNHADGSRRNRAVGTAHRGEKWGSCIDTCWVC